MYASSGLTHFQPCQMPLGTRTSSGLCSPRKNSSVCPRVAEPHEEVVVVAQALHEAAPLVRDHLELLGHHAVDHLWSPPLTCGEIAYRMPIWLESPTMKR